ncbi:glucan endo-1,3-beta-glucosidase-like [Mangifera indica]|uniref:glucan endo-1,3-beta-glucosidase-like n=1 Tax=Mangifera indica TaxID=29780 RepID=UPI001CFA86F0|nr:glucan endo-1,3-beta-glucosidase-like [Mangifera indica]
MANLTLPFRICFLLLCFFSASGGFSKMVNVQGIWCVANPGADISALLINLDYACGHIDCDPVRPGGSCFYPDTYIDHASFAMNLYFQSNCRNLSSCGFRETGQIVTRDPSYGNCIYGHNGCRL